MRGKLIYTVALDSETSDGRPYRRMGQLLVSSLLRTGSESEILVIRDARIPLFNFPLEGVREVGVQPDPKGGFRAATQWKMQARSYFEAAQYEKILYLDCDCLALRNPDSLMEGDWDLSYQLEDGKPRSQPYFNSYLTPQEISDCDSSGINGGTFATRGECLDLVLERWEDVLKTPPVRPLYRSGSDQSGWNRVVMDAEKGAFTLSGSGRLVVVPFPKDAVRFPYHEQLDIDDCAAGTILHFAWGQAAKMRAEQMTDAYLQLFYGPEPLSLSAWMDPTPPKDAEPGVIL